MLSKISFFETVMPWGEGVLPYKRLMEMCSWMRSHFHDWIDYSGVVFLIEFLVKNGVVHFRIFRGKTVLHIYG